MNRWMIVFVAILVVGGAMAVVQSRSTRCTVAQLAPRTSSWAPSPDFTLATLGGESFALDDLRGIPVVLNFWATWCGPCQRELPALQGAAERYAGEVLIVGVDQGEAAETVQKYVDDLGLTFPVPMDAELEVGNRYNVKGMPTTYFIDGNGIIRHTWTGEMNSVTLAEGIAKIWP